MPDSKAIMRPLASLRCSSTRTVLPCETVYVSWPRIVIRSRASSDQ